MKFSVILLGAALYLFSSTEAGITTNTPFSTVTWNGGNTESVVWDDDGKAPKLAEIGITTIDLMAGGDVNQVLVKNIGKAPATAKKIDYVVPKDVGPPGDFYFIKYTAGTYTAFSGKFSIANVNGKIAGFDPKQPNAKTGNPPTTGVTDPKATDPKAKDGAVNPAYPPPTGDPKTAPIAVDPKAAPKAAAPATTPSSLPSPASAANAVNNAASLLPSFAGVATAAAALALFVLN